MSKKPVIGIILDLAKDSKIYQYAPLPWYALRQQYASNIEDFGGVPLMVPYVSDINSMLDLVDGIIIPGGNEDIDPKYYGQEITSKRVITNDERAEFEFAITKAALKRNMPVLGICNGLQLINIIFGGTLIQHLPDSINSEINNEQPPPKNVPSHDILLEKDSLLYEFNDKEIETIVNSTHHQAIDKVGEGLKVSAVAPDGVIEAIESSDHKFLIAVQWHLEYLNTKLDKNILKNFIEKCSS
ncbi:MAG: gamma-glutamyl-gamma-aminobutyrate hydrolase family protein [Rickettsiaceae bacterium]|nr:gamma-glutamyl-gamma-aminobutyrate hydrolase family protein [Rickettsiaceae bacterium]